MQQGGIELDGAAAGTTPKEIYRSAPVNHIGSPLPSLWRADGFHSNVSASVAGQRANLRHHILGLCDIHNRVRPHALGRHKLAMPFAYRYHPGAFQLCQTDEHQSDGPHADNGHNIVALQSGFFQPAQHAGQGLHQGGVDKVDVVRNFQQILPDNRPRDANVLRVRSIVKQQPIAEVGAVPKAITAFPARSGVGSNHPHPCPNIPDLRADLFHYTRQLMSENRRGFDHASMISLTIYFEVCSTGQGSLDPNQHFVGTQGGNGHLFDFQVFFAVQNGSCHSPRHCCSYLTGPRRIGRADLAPGWTIRRPAERSGSSSSRTQRRGQPASRPAGTPCQPP